MTENLEPDELSLAISELQQFLTVDISQIKTLPDLSQQASHIGNDLYLFLKHQGKKKLIKSPILDSDTLGWQILSLEKTVDESFVLLSGTRQSIFVMKWDNQQAMPRDMLKAQGIANLWIEIPVQNSIVLASNIELFAMIRREEAIKYYPSNQPEEATIQQGYAKVLQEIVNDLLR